MDEYLYGYHYNKDEEYHDSEGYDDNDDFVMNCEHDKIEDDLEMALANIQEFGDSQLWKGIEQIKNAPYRAYWRRLFFLAGGEVPDNTFEIN